MTGKLVFIGLGLHDEYGMSLRGQTEAKSCNLLFTEHYTNPMPNLNLKNLETLTGKRVVVLSRKDVEEDAQLLIISRAISDKVGFLVPGDPMAATTHVDLRLRAHRAGIETRIVHSSSITTAIAGVTGLQSYKFGRTVTIPIIGETHIPESTYLGIKSNLTGGLHSLVLLEFDVEADRHVTIPEALKRLLTTCASRHEDTITERTLVIGAARIEAPDMSIKAGPIADVLQWSFGSPPFVLVIPGQLHFLEAEALHAFCSAPEESVKSKP
jgi:diphthine synthase